VVQIRGGLVDGACVALSLAASLAVYWIAEGHIAGAASLSSFPLDDSWIHLHFARNLAEGAGFAYNPGVPVSGSTAPLWTLLLAGAFSLAGSAPAWAKALGITAALATALLTRRLVWMWTESRALALAGGVIAAVAGPLVWGALSGMEVSLAALLVTGAIVLHTAGRDAPTALLLGLAGLTRPESLLLVPLVWLGRPITPGRTAIFAGIVGALLSPWVAFNLATAGTPLPATASAKVEGGLIGVLSGSRDSLAALVQRPWQFEMEWIRWLFSVDVLLPVLLLPGLWGLWRMRGRAAGLPALVLVLHPVGMAQAPDRAQPPAHRVDPRAHPLERQGLPRREELDRVGPNELAQVGRKPFRLDPGRNGQHDGPASGAARERRREESARGLRNRDRPRAPGRRGGDDGVGPEQCCEPGEGGKISHR